MATLPKLEADFLKLIEDDMHAGRSLMQLDNDAS